jgi:hypothetical protein
MRSCRLNTRVSVAGAPAGAPAGASVETQRTLPADAAAFRNATLPPCARARAPAPPLGRRDSDDRDGPEQPPMGVARDTAWRPRQPAPVRTAAAAPPRRVISAMLRRVPAAAVPCLRRVAGVRNCG